MKKGKKFGKREKVWKKKRKPLYWDITMDGTVKLILMKTSKLSPSTLYNLQWDTGGGM